MPLKQQRFRTDGIALCPLPEGGIEIVCVSVFLELSSATVVRSAITLILLLSAAVRCDRTSC